jgi:hypothetical protein
LPRREQRGHAKGAYYLEFMVASQPLKNGDILLFPPFPARRKKAEKEECPHFQGDP